MRTSQDSVKPLEVRHNSTCSSKFPTLTDSSPTKPINSELKKRLEEIDENYNYLHTMSHSITDRFKPQKKKRKSIVSNSKSNIFQSHRFQLSEGKKSNFKKKIVHRKVFSYDSKNNKQITFSIGNNNTIPQVKKQKNLSSSPQNNVNNVSFKTFRSDLGRNKINKISTCEGSSLTKFNVFKMQLSKTLSQLVTPTKNLEHVKQYTDGPALTEVLSKKYKPKHVYIFKSNNFLTDELRCKDILCQYNQISKISPIDIYRLRKELCFQMGLNLIEKENEIGFERRYKKNMSYVTPKWVFEFKKKQKAEMKLIKDIRERTKFQFENLFRK